MKNLNRIVEIDLVLGAIDLVLGFIPFETMKDQFSSLCSSSITVREDFCNLHCPFPG
jgi:hypothetical protein